MPNDVLLQYTSFVIASALFVIETYQNILSDIPWIIQRNLKSKCIFHSPVQKHVKNIYDFKILIQLDRIAKLSSSYLSFQFYPTQNLKIIAMAKEVVAPHQRLHEQHPTSDDDQSGLSRWGTPSSQVMVRLHTAASQVALKCLKSLCGGGCGGGESELG